MKSDQKGFSVIEVLIVVVVAGLIGTAGWFVYDRQSSKSNKQQTTNTQTREQTNTAQAPGQAVTPVTLSKGTFGNSGEYGTLQIEGYTTTTKVDEPFCLENCKKYDYLFFHITETENTNIFAYLKKLGGNSFVQDKAIGIGCIADGQISYSNSSDAKGTAEYKLTKEDTAAIMAATAEKPIQLDIERLELTGGKDAPACYSHFTTFKLIR